MKRFNNNSGLHCPWVLTQIFIFFREGIVIIFQDCDGSWNLGAHHLHEALGFVASMTVDVHPPHGHEIWLCLKISFPSLKPRSYNHHHLYLSPWSIPHVQTHMLWIHETSSGAQPLADLGATAIDRRDLQEASLRGLGTGRTRIVSSRWGVLPQ